MHMGGAVVAVEADNGDRLRCRAGLFEQEQHGGVHAAVPVQIDCMGKRIPDAASRLSRGCLRASYDASPISAAVHLDHMDPSIAVTPVSGKVLFGSRAPHWGGPIAHCGVRAN